MGAGPALRGLAVAGALCASTPCCADSCGALADRVTSATGIEIGARESELVSYPVDPDTLVTLVCGTAESTSSVGARHRGETPPDSYFLLFGRAGQVVTGIAAERIGAAAQRAWTNAPKHRHSNVPTDGVLVTCTVSRAGTGDAMTMCAVIAQSVQI